MARKIIGRSAVPEPVTPKSAKFGAVRTITASAMKIDLTDRQVTQELANQTVRAAWHADAWRVYNAVGEIKFAYGLVAAVMSRLRIYPAFVPGPEDVPVALVNAAEIERPESEIDDAAIASHAYHRTIGLTPQQAKRASDMYNDAMRGSNVPNMLRNFGLNVNVPGECYLAKINNKWVIKSTSELRVQSDGAKMYKTSAATPKDLPAGTVIGRVWREDAQYSFDSDSSLRALIRDCDELLMLSRVIRNNAMSRLNAGILFVPDEVVVAKRTETDDAEIEAEEELDFEKELYESIIAAVQDEDSAASVFPLLLRGPGEVAEFIKHIKLERIIDEFLVQRADRTLERIMQGLDVPKDLVTGLANIKYSNAVQIDDSLYKAHLEPLALTFVDAVTEIIFRPSLMDLLTSDDPEVQAEGWTPELVEQLVVWYDPSEVVTRPDRAADALALYTRKELSGQALRKAHGFTEDDAPDEQELARRLAIEGTIPEPVMQILLQKILPNVLKRLQAAAGGEAGGLPDSLSEVLDGGGDDGSLGDPALEPTIPEGTEPSVPSAPTEQTYGSPTSPGQPPASSAPLNA